MTELCALPDRTSGAERARAVRPATPVSADGVAGVPAGEAEDEEVAASAVGRRVRQRNR